MSGVVSDILASSQQSFTFTVLVCSSISCFVSLPGHYMLQLRVVACFLILVAGRVINVFVPIYYKKIVDGLTFTKNGTSQLDSSLVASLGISVGGTKIMFPLGSIGIYVMLKFMQVGQAFMYVHVNTCTREDWNE